MNCEYCQQPFEALNRNGSRYPKRFCSERCRKRAETKRSAWKKRNKVKTRTTTKVKGRRGFMLPRDGFCGVCQAAPVAGRRKYCSDKCVKWSKRCWEGGYELTIPEYEVLKKAANGKCQSCGAPEGNKLLQVDHCHSTGAVRGLICGKCNSAAAMAGDNPERLRDLAAYLERFQKGP